MNDVFTSPESDFQHSAQLGELFEALAAAQAEMGHAHKNAKNPHYKSTYADLAEVIDSTRPVLSKHGLALTQFPVGESGLLTLLGHKSGEWIRGRMQMTPKDASPQAAGSCLTYARRYSSAAVAGIGQEDDDGNEASKPASPPQKAPATKAASKTAPAPKPVAGIFTGTEEQQKIVADILRKKGTPEDLWPKICDRMMGKPSTALKSVIDDVTEEIASGPYA